MFRSFLQRLFRSLILTLPPILGQSLLFLKRNGYWPDINNPRTFNEKILRRKLKDFPSTFVDYSDKLKVKSKVESLLGSDFVTPTLWSGTMLPDEQTLLGFLPFVLKANFGNNRTAFCTRQDDLNYNKLKSLSESWLNGPAQDPLCHEEWYGKIKRFLLIEPHLTRGEKAPDDFKVFCFSGKPLFIQVDSDRFSLHKRDFYDQNWNYINNFSLLYPNSSKILERPVFLPDLVKAASILSNDFDFVRVDFYCLPHLRFGEFTFAPDSGWGRFSRRDVDLLWGDLWK